MGTKSSAGPWALGALLIGEVVLNPWTISLVWCCLCPALTGLMALQGELSL